MNNFLCLNCHKKVDINQVLGIANTNHCPYCLASKHVDRDVPGDREAICKQIMEPIGLTFKQVGLDKWGKEKQGELMIIHECCGCDKISINRVSGADDPKKILEVLENSKNLSQSAKDKLEEAGIKLLTEKDLTEVKIQLYGKS